MLDDVLKTGLTFDDVLLMPAKSEVLPKDVLRDSDKQYHITEFKGIKGAGKITFRSFAQSNRPADFEWAVIGDAVPAMETTALEMGPRKK